MVSVSETRFICESEDPEFRSVSIPNGISCIHFLEDNRLMRLGTIADERIGSASRWFTTLSVGIRCNDGSESHNGFLMKANRGTYIALLEGVDRMSETVDLSVAIDV